MRSSRLPPAAFLNDTSMTFHGSASCRVAVNNIVVSIPPKLPRRHHLPGWLTHTKQRKAFLFLRIPKNRLAETAFIRVCPVQKTGTIRHGPN